jgi:hypothetical protein
MTRHVAAQLLLLHHCEHAPDAPASGSARGAAASPTLPAALAVPVLDLMHTGTFRVRGTLRLFTLLLEILGSSLTLLPHAVCPPAPSGDSAAAELGLSPAQPLCQLSPFADSVSYALAAAWRTLLCAPAELAGIQLRLAELTAGEPAEMSVSADDAPLRTLAASLGRPEGAAAAGASPSAPAAKRPWPRSAWSAWSTTSRFAA